MREPRQGPRRRSVAALLRQAARCGALAAAFLVLPPGGPCWGLEKVSLQLKWKHQFQFAGYYAALEQGFYRDAGLDVEIREGGPDVDAGRELDQGRADFGVCTADVLLRKPGSPEIVVLGVIFQHSAAVLVVPSRARIGNLSEMRGRRLMDAPGNGDLAAMLRREGVDYSGLTRVRHDGDPRDLALGRADAMVGYSTNEPFVLEQLGVPYRIFSPRVFGIDFYGDSLCTLAREADAHPQRTRAFLDASLKGWAHALAHKEDTVRLILDRYSARKSRDALMFEAVQTEGLVQPQLIALGSQSRLRWQSIARTWRQIGMLAGERLPPRLIYSTGDARRAWLMHVVLPAAAALLLCLAGLWLLYRLLARRLARAAFRPKLSAVMSALFIGLSIPILIFVLAFNYQRNSEAILVMLQEQMAKTRQASIERTTGMIRGVAGTLNVLAEIAATDPGFFRTEASRDTLYRALTSAAEIDAIYVSFEDGYHRVVTRIDDDRRRSDAAIPANASWHSSYIDDFSLGEDRRRHRTFFDVWPNVVKQYAIPTTLDIRVLAGYAEARESAAVVVTAPTINPDTGYPIISVRVPIVRQGRFLGCASVNITFDVLTRFLDASRASRNARTIIADPMLGTIIAASEKEKAVRMVDGRLEVARLENVGDADVREAYRLHVQTSQDEFVFPSPASGGELSVSFARFPESFGNPWQSIVLAPTDDFVGSLKATNRQIIMLIVALSAIELLLIYALSRRLSQPIEGISRELKSVESLSFEPVPPRPSGIMEIAQLQSAVALLGNSLKSFSSFAPLDVVKDLIKSGIPLKLGVETRPLTVFFSDLEDFSTHAEQMESSELLAQMSAYFEQVSQAISQENGTIDKFIGDGVMAFWGAPLPVPDHALRACVGALRAARRLDAINAAWRAQGRRPFRIRIGLNTGDVLVGNVGSSERFSYTAMGDGVNVAARLEGINKMFGTTICISDSVFEAVAPQIVARPLRRVRVKGRKQDFMVYELLGIAGSADPELAPRPDARRLRDVTRAASDCFETADLAGAAQRYRDILRLFPDDPVARSMLKACAGAGTPEPPGRAEADDQGA